VTVSRVEAPMPHVLRALLVPLAALVVAGCSLLPVPQPPARAQAQPGGQDPMVEALQRWRASGITDYTWQVEFACECGLSGTWVVTVEDGKVAKALKPNGEVATGPVPDVPLTVDALLTKAQEAYGAGAAGGATWPGDNGVPSELTIDPKPNVVDDELSVKVVRFDPAP
jgi:hypothetical protein